MFLVKLNLFNKILIMPTLAIIFFILGGFYTGMIFGILLSHAVLRWKEEDHILAEDVDKWMEENEQ